MAIDFSDMLEGGDETVSHPRDIFLTLNRASAFSFPRDIQTEVLNKWYDDKDLQDNIIKLNVGSGKTLVGLLILKSCLSDNKGPSLYVCPDRQLCQQVINEASALGIATTEDPRDPGYLAGDKICVINIYKLFNGKSVFGVGAAQIEIGSVIIDDAHACISTITDQFRISIENTKEPYKRIFRALSEDLKGYNEAKFLDIADGDPRAQMEVPFWSWNAHFDEILKSLHESRDDDFLAFTYPLVKEILRICRCVISGQRIEIEPPFPTTDLIQSFRRAKRRVYMTATLSDDSVIVTHFGADPKSIGKPIVPTSSQSMGERMIIMPQELNSELSTAEIRTLLVDLAKTVNVVVIVPSSFAADDWKASANQVLIGESVVDGIEKQRKGLVGLTVLVNRYDGIDLPGDACRVLAIVGLPEVNSYSDIVDSEVLSGTNINLRRQVERTEQGMGRGVRSNDDYCAVILLGAKLIGRLRSTDAQGMLTPATKVQLELSRKIAKRLDKPSIKQIDEVIRQCLNRDPGWMTVSKKALVGLKADDVLKFDEAKIGFKRSFDSARSNQYHDAIATLDKTIDQIEEIQLKAWLLAKKAAYQHFLDPDGAQKSLVAAHAMEPGILKPMIATTYKKLNAAAGLQAETVIANHKKRFMDLTSMKLFADELCSDLRFSVDTSDKFEAAVNDLAWFIGIQGQRPERDYKEGPDNLWALPSGAFLIIECKNGVTAGSGISKKDAGQLGQSVAWFLKRYPASAYTPIMIHPEKKLGQAASPVERMSIIDTNSLEKLRNNIRGFAQQLLSPDVAASAGEIAKRLNHFELSSDSFANAFTAPPKA